LAASDAKESPLSATAVVATFPPPQADIARAAIAEVHAAMRGILADFSNMGAAYELRIAE
jgi:hypothetical protein